MTPSRAELGFTLIEMVIVVLLITLAVGGIALSIGATDQARLRSSCWTVAAAVRYAYSHAVTQGATVRLVLDFESRSVHLEETRGRVVLNKEDETGEGLRREGDEFFDGDGGVAGGSLVDRAMNAIGESLAQGFGNEEGSKAGGGSAATAPGSLGMGMEMLGLGGAGMGSGADDPGMALMMEDFTGERITDPFLASMQSPGGNPAGYRRPRFTPLPGRRGEVRELEGDTSFLTVYTPHAPKPQEEGKAYIYFFPGGMTEHAIIQLSDGDERVYSIEVHPLTGRSVIIPEAIEPEAPLDELNEAEQ